MSKWVKSFWKYFRLINTLKYGNISERQRTRIEKELTKMEVTR